MGWSGQGYFEEADEFDPKWIVASGNGDHNNEIASFQGKSINNTLIKNSIRIFYGVSDMEYFRGVSTINHLDTLKTLLRNFNGYPVYKTKHFGVHYFNINNLRFHTFEDVIFFHEYRDWEKGEWADLMWDIEQNFNNYLPNSLKTDLTTYYKV